VTGAKAIEQGRAYQMAEHARVVEISDRGRRIVGEVQGTVSRPYRQSVAICDSSIGDSSWIDSICSCPVGGRCKHVAA